MADASYSESVLPLAGRSVIVTRTREQAAELVEPLEELGAEVLSLPVIAIVEPDDWGQVDIAIAHLSDYDWLVLTSTNGVDRFLARVREHGLDPAERLASSGVNVAAVGSATAARLQSAGVAVDLVPRGFHAEGLVDAFRDSDACHGRRVLIPRALDAREVLPESLRELGCEVDVVPVYRTVPADPDAVVLDRIRKGTVDAVTFTSGSTVRNFIALLDKVGLDAARHMQRLVVASIGPVTTEALKRRGFEPDVEAIESTMTALAAAVGAHYSQGVEPSTR
jgi:uroporphyrinogen III methyltransferase/synthase